MKTKIITAFLAAALLTAAFTGCNTSTDSSAAPETSAAASSDEAKLEKKTFNLGHLNSTAHLLGFVAKEEGFFEEEGLDVTLTLFSSAAELSSGLENDKLDVAFIGSVPTLTFQSQGHDLTIFGGEMTNDQARIC